MDLHEIFRIGPQCANGYEVTLNLTQPHLPSFVMTYHDLATQLNQTFIFQPNLDGFLYFGVGWALGTIGPCVVNLVDVNLPLLLDFHKIFSIGPEWANKYEVTLTLTQPHLPSFVMTYHDLAPQLNQTFISQPNLDGSPRNFQHRPTKGKQIWSGPKPNPTSPTLSCHDLSWPSHPIKSNLHISAKSWWISTKFLA